MPLYIVTLIVSFTYYSVPCFNWACVLIELMEDAPLRRSCQATVLFREALYDAGLLSAFGVHASRWRHVMTDIAFHYGDGFRNVSTTSPESWDDDLTAITAAVTDTHAADEDFDDAGEWDDDDIAAIDTATDAHEVEVMAFRAHMSKWERVMHELVLIHASSPASVFRHVHLGPVHLPSLFRRRRSVSLRIALARKLTARAVRRSLLAAFNTVPPCT